LISLPRPTQMLHFGQFALPSASKGVYREISFGNPGINGRMHLPQAYRSLPRPSSLTKPSHSPTGVFARLIPSHFFSKSTYPLQRLVMSIKICFDTFFVCLSVYFCKHTHASSICHYNLTYCTLMLPDYAIVLAIKCT
jgi:hypothetical protein